MIKGKRVILRPVEERDLSLIVEWRNDPQNRRFFFSPLLINPAGQRQWLQNLLADGTRILMMVDTHAGKTIGMLGLNNIDWRNQECEGGQLLLDPNERGQGYAEEASALIIRYAFEDLNLHRMYVYSFAFNPVIKLLESRLGFKQEGVLRKAAFAQGEFHDKVVLAVLREEWMYWGLVDPPTNAQ